MFTCNECIVREDTPEFPIYSYGPCEICGKTSRCYDLSNDWFLWLEEKRGKEIKVKKYESNKKYIAKKKSEKLNKGVK